MYYDYDIAQKQVDNNATAKGPDLKIDKNHELANFIEEEIEEKCSPEVIAEKIKKSDKFKISIFHKTIYNYIEKGVLLLERDELVYGNYRK